MRKLPFENKFLVCDMDGTLLNKENLVSMENTRALEYFVKGGGLFSLATGRTHKGVKKYVEELPVNMPVMTINGAQIYDFKLQKSIWDSYMGNDIDDLLRLLIAEFPGLGVEVFAKSGVYACRMNDTTEWHRLKEEIVPGVVEFEKVPKPWYKVTLAWDNSNLQKVDAFLKGKTGTSNAVFSEEVFIDVMNVKTSKGAALEHLAGIFKIPLEDVIAVGDNLNDLEMIEVAGMGVAVDNAHEEVKKAAQLCTVNHNDHAIEKIIKFLEENG